MPALEKGMKCGTARGSYADHYCSNKATEEVPWLARSQRFVCKICARRLARAKLVELGVYDEEWSRKQLGHGSL